MPKAAKAPRVRSAGALAEGGQSPNPADLEPVTRGSWPLKAPIDVPPWLRTDWSETSFSLPVFLGDSKPGSQIKWAAKNATVAIHDAYAARSWEGIANRPLAIYLAVCDVVLQRYVERGV